MATDFTKPYYGVTPDELVAQGLDPDEVEAGRLSHVEWQAEKRAQDAAELVAVARAGVAAGELLPAEAAKILLDGGHSEAHAAFWEKWKSDEAADAASTAADDLALLDADDYALHFAQAEAQRIEAEKYEGGIELGKQLAKQLSSVMSANDPLIESARETIMQKVAETQAEGQAIDQPRLVGSSVVETAANARQVESLRQEAEDLWRAKKSERMHGPSMTTSEYELAKDKFVEDHFASRTRQVASAQSSRSKADHGFRPAIVTDDPYHTALRRAEAAAGIVRDENGMEVALPLAPSPEDLAPAPEPKMSEMERFRMRNAGLPTFTEEIKQKNKYSPGSGWWQKTN